MSNKLKLDDSAFAMWRGIAAFAYVDHKLSEQEIGFFKKQLSNIQLTPQQQEILDNDLANGVKLSDVYDDITEPRHRTHLLNLGYVIFHRDGDYSEVEKNFYEEVYRAHFKTMGMDVDKVMDDAEKHSKENLENWSKKKSLAGLPDRIKEFFSWLF